MSKINSEKLKHLFRTEKIFRITIFLLYCGIVIFFVMFQLSKNETVEFESEKLVGDEYVAIVEKYESMIETLGVRSALLRFQDEINTNNKLENSCHSIIHSIGQKAYSELQSVPEALLYQDEVCNSGYTHGVLESYFVSLENITSDVGKVCNESKSDFQMWQCYHGIGHGFMFFTNNDLYASLDYCKSLVSKKAEACANGVLMENFGGDGSIHTSAYVDINDPNNPCANLDIAVIDDCYVYVPTYYLLQNKDDYSGAVKWCDDAFEEHKDSCVRGVGGQFIKDFIVQPERINEFCMGLNSENEQYCYEGASSFLVFYYGEIDQALDTCKNFINYQGLCLAIVTDKEVMFSEKFLE